MIFVLLFWFSVVFGGGGGRGGSVRGARSKKGHSSPHDSIRKLSFCSLSLEPSFAFSRGTCFTPLYLCHWEAAPPSSPSATETHRSVQEGRARGLATQGSCHPASRAKSQSSLQIFFDATFHGLPHLLKAAFQLSGVAATAC